MRAVGRWGRVVLLALSASLLLVLGAKAAPGFPSRPITWLVAFAPGGQSDIEVRRVQPHLERLFGVRILVQYRTGGGGAVGWSELVRSPADGHTVAGLVMPHIVLQPLVRGVEAGYRTDQIRAVAWTVSSPTAIMVRHESPFRTLQDLVNHARANPGRVAVGGVERLTVSDLALAQFTRPAGIHVTYVPITGGAGPVMTALIGGHVDAAITALSHGIRHRDRVRILAHAGRQRIPGIPDVPTFRELGHNVTAELTWGVGVPAGTPAEAINRLSSTLLQVMRQPEILNALPDEGLVPMFLGPAESQAFVNRQVSVYRELIGLLR